MKLNEIRMIFSILIHANNMQIDFNINIDTNIDNNIVLEMIA
jgi:hypothetical protein